MRRRRAGAFGALDNRRCSDGLAERVLREDVARRRAVVVRALRLGGLVGGAEQLIRAARRTLVGDAVAVDAAGGVVAPQATRGRVVDVGIASLCVDTRGGRVVRDDYLREREAWCERVSCAGDVRDRKSRARLQLAGLEGWEDDLRAARSGTRKPPQSARSTNDEKSNEEAASRARVEVVEDGSARHAKSNLVGGELRNIKRPIEERAVGKLC